MKPYQAILSALQSRTWPRDLHGLGLVVAASIVLLHGSIALTTFVNQDQRIFLNAVIFLLLYVLAICFAWGTATQPTLHHRLRLPWRLLAGALLCNIVGNLLWLLYSLQGEIPFPSWADAAYLCYYPLLLGMLFTFPQQSQLTKHYTFWLDVGTVVIGGGMLCWYFVVLPTAAAASNIVLEALLALAYPVASLVLLFGIVSVALRHPRYASHRSINILLSGLGLGFIADLIFSVLNLNDLYQSGGWSDTLYALRVFLFTVSADAQRRQAGLYAEEAEHEAAPAMPRFNLLPYAAVASGFAVLLWSVYASKDLAAWQLALGAIALTTLVTLRQIFAVQENGRLLLERAALEGESRLRALVEYASDIILIVTAEGHIQYRTSSSERIFGPLSGSEGAVSVFDSLHTDDLSKARVYLDRLVSQPGAAVPVEWRVRHQDGIYRAVETIGNNLLQNEVVRGVVLTLRDISERQARQEAEATSKMKSAFIANISHELRTPLTAILGYSELLEHELKEAQQQRFVPDVETIRQAGQHLLVLINDVLDLSKIEAGKMVLVPQLFDLNALVSEISIVFEPLIARNGNTLMLDCPAELPTMYTDLMRVRQVLINLLSNAAKFTKNGTVTIRVRPAASGHLPQGQVANPDMITINVIDTGIGIAADHLGSLFQPFIQAAPSTTQHYGGTGLGLALSRHFCQLLRGTIDITSKLGRGTTVTIQLPTQLPQQDPVALQDPATTTR